MFKPYKYVKDDSFDPIYKPINKKFILHSSFYHIFLFFIGIFLLVTQVVIPLVYFKTADEIAKPVSSSVLGLVSGFREFEFSELDTVHVKGATSTNTNIPKYFYLTIPKLNIHDALVETNAATLNPEHALGHYAGSSLPGETGNAFIYGHSVLPWFYNPRNYKTIFTTLNSLETGDTFFVDYNNKTLVYKVESILTLSPEEVDPLAEIKPRFLNESTITLMTCVPPGTKFKRLLVNGVLVH